MRVSELVAKLSALPQDLEVVIDDHMADQSGELIAVEHFPGNVEGDTTPPTVFLTVEWNDD